jgi:cytochrome c oxidase assembly factor CtaG
MWHIPALYQATLDNELIHALQHICFLGTAVLFWWTLIHGSYGRLGYGVAFLYVFTTAVHTSVLGALMTFAQRIWYPIYDGRTAPWHLTPLQDQQLGGLIMWIPSGTVFLVVGLAMFAAWLGESERRGKLSRLDALNGKVEAEHAA